MTILSAGNPIIASPAGTTGAGISPGARTVMTESRKLPIDGSTQRFPAPAVLVFHGGVS